MACPFSACGRLDTQHKCARLLKNLEHTQSLLLGQVFKVLCNLLRKKCKVMSNFSNESDPGGALTEYFKHSGILKEL